MLGWVRTVSCFRALGKGKVVIPLWVMLEEALGSDPCSWAGWPCSGGSWFWAILISFIGLVGQGKVRPVSWHVLEQLQESANLPG